MIEDRHSVGEAYCASFERLGMALQSFARADFEEWFGTISANDMASVEGYLVGQTDSTISLIETIRLRTEQPVIAMVDSIRTDMLVRYYSVGVDDVVRKPVHAREISCRINAVQRRISRSAEPKINPEIHIFSDGQNPIVGGYPLELPRRERRLLEFLVVRAGRRVTKEQIFNGIYGIFEESVNESVVESHVSKLRKKLRERLGYDPIDSKRYLGYCFQQRTTIKQDFPSQRAIPICGTEADAEIAFLALTQKT